MYSDGAAPARKWGVSAGRWRCVGRISAAEATETAEAETEAAEVAVRSRWRAR